MRPSLAALIVALVIAFLAIGLSWAAEPAGAFLGLFAGFSSRVLGTRFSRELAMECPFQFGCGSIGSRLARFPRADGAGMQLASDAASVSIAANSSMRG